MKLSLEHGYNHQECLVQSKKAGIMFMFMKQSKFLWCLDGIESDMTTCRAGWLVMVAESSTSSFDLIYDKISSHAVCTHSLVVTKPILPLNSLSFSNHFAYHIVFLCYHMISCFLYYSATKPMTVPACKSSKLPAW